ncbi:hypothetical protein GCM10022423_06570 [Flavobacterium ginsengiterrae]|uniref:Uncharacterized protein n=1 Tax=Flavobacterium ginsengiterrae TaxID=871695 RepID=A0ABP7G9J4_9FLAO
MKFIKVRTHSLLKLWGKNNKEFLYLKLITNFYTINVQLDIENRKVKKGFKRKEHKVFFKKQFSKMLKFAKLINKKLCEPYLILCALCG